MNDLFKTRLQKAMDIKGIIPADLSKITKISKPRITEYLKGTYKPKQQGIYSLAKALNVNEAWLMGIDNVPMERVEKENQDLTVFNLIEKQYGNQTKHALELYIKLDNDNKVKINNEMEQMLQSQNKITNLHPVQKVARSLDGSIEPTTEYLTEQEISILENCKEDDTL